MSPEARELLLYADNDGRLYAISFKPIVETLRRHLNKGRYNPTLATKLWMYHAERAAKAYEKEFLNPGEWKTVFPKSARKEAAEHWESYARREHLGIASHDRVRIHRRPRYRS